MEKYRVCMKRTDKEKRIFLSIRKLPIEDNDPINKLNFESRDFNEDEKDKFFECLSGIVSYFKTERDYILIAKIDPQLPDSVTERARKILQIKGETNFRVTVGKQPNRINRWPIGIDPCEIESIISQDDFYNYIYFNDEKSVVEYIENEAIPFAREQGYEPVINAGTDTPNSLLKRLEGTQKKLIGLQRGVKEKESEKPRGVDPLLKLLRGE